MTRIIRGATVSFVQTRRCASCSIGKSLNRIEDAALCDSLFTNYDDIVPDHINPKGMGGAWRDDHPENIQAVHWWCNGDKGIKPALVLVELPSSTDLRWGGRWVERTTFPNTIAGYDP